MEKNKKTKKTFSRIDRIPFQWNIHGSRLIEMAILSVASCLCHFIWVLYCPTLHSDIFNIPFYLILNDTKILSCKRDKGFYFYQRLFKYSQGPILLMYTRKHDLYVLTWLSI